MRNRKKRQQYQRFVVEGVRPITQMLAHEWKVEAWVYTNERRLSEWAQESLAAAADADHYVLTADLMDELSDKEDGSELLALAAIPADRLERIPVPLSKHGEHGTGEQPLLVLLDRPANPGNIGSIIRSCDSFRVHGIVMTGHSADPYDPLCIRSSVGSLFSVPVVRQGAPADLDPWLTELREAYPTFQVIGTTARTSKPLADVDFTRPTLLLIGNETVGLSRTLKDTADELVRIPIHGTASSLNVACAASISLYEVDQQRLGQ